MVRDKYKSRKFLVAVWAILMFTFIVVYSMITQFVPDYATFVLPSLIAIIISWVGSETYLKKYNAIISSTSTQRLEDSIDTHVEEKRSPPKKQRIQGK